MKRWYCLAGCLWPLVALAADLPAISVFETESAKAVIPPSWVGKVTRYNLDDLAHAEAAINRTLPADPDNARAMAEKLIKTPQGGLQAGWNALMKMALYQVEYVPAIVFGRGEAIWYGRDLATAVQAWQRHRDTQRP